MWITSKDLDMTEPQTRDVTVDAFLCDAVQSIGGKLYVLGAGWNSIMTAAFPMTHRRIGVALMLRVPYTATNQQHEFNLRIDSEDGQSIPLAAAPPGMTAPWVSDDKQWRVGGAVNLGRPPDLVPGDEQIACLGMELDQIEFSQPGAYAVVVELDGAEGARLPFRVRQMQGVITGQPL